MAFEWNRIHKHEDNVEQDVNQRVYDYVLEYYAVESIEDLNGDQIAEIEQFREEYNEYSVMQIGFSNLLSEYESAHG
jgi:hypothetical protein